MPWCVTCDRYLAPPAVRPDGTCPACTHPVEPGGARPAPPAAPDAAAEREGPPPVPWHLKLLAGALAVYLGFRFYEMAEWLWRRL